MREEKVIKNPFKDLKNELLSQFTFSDLKNPVKRIKIKETLQTLDDCSTRYLDLLRRLKNLTRYF